MKSKAFIVVMVFIELFIFSACILDTENTGFHFDEKTFTSEWNAWEDKNIQNYRFTMTGELPHEYFSRAILMYEYTVNIIVKNGSMDSFEYIGNIPYTEDGESVLEPEFTSISDMYQKISNSAEYEKKWWKENTGGGIVSTTFKVKYDAQLHYITFFEPVSKWEPGWEVDTTAHAVTISNFVVIEN